MKIGVIIGRFQLWKLHAGHLDLFNQVSLLCDRVIVLVGVSPTVTDRNPLSFQAREKILRRYLEIPDIYPICDHPDDDVWSDNVDIEIRSVINQPYDSITLYGSRDSFISSYTGKYPTEEIGSVVPYISSTKLRQNLVKGAAPSEPGTHSKTGFNQGIIYNIETRHPVAYPTVDIGVINFSNDLNYRLIVLGRKKYEKRWRFPGGFVDPSDESLEAAAYRELHEEMPGIEHHELKYVKSYKINDWRYKGSKDGIITSLFTTTIMGGRVKAGDDLEAVGYFRFEEGTAYKSFLNPCHYILWETLINYYKK